MAYTYHMIIYGRVLHNMDCRKNPELKKLYDHLSNLSERGWPGVEKHWSHDDNEQTCSVGWMISSLDPSPYISADSLTLQPTSEQLARFEEVTEEVLESLDASIAKLFLDLPCKTWFVSTAA